MIIEQTLHGYYKGHGLLASSFIMKPSNDSSLMSTLSDWTGYRDESDEDAYMTFYPLDSGKKYAIAKSWYASEMERPGCVWTHTLIVDLNDIDRNFDFRILTNYFKRPKKNEYEYYQKKIEIDTFDKRNSNCIFHVFDSISLLVMYLFLICGNKNLVIHIDKSQNIYAELCLYFLQYIPLGILKTTSFSTGSSSYRKCGEADFSIQFTDNEVSVDLATAPWNEKLTIENFDEGIRYIYEESQKENDQLPSLIRLFSDDILDDKNKLIGFAILMKRLDMAIKGNAKIEQYADILHLFEEYFPGIEDGMVLKYNFLSQKISHYFGTEKDILYQIAVFNNVAGLASGIINYKSRVQLLHKENKSDFISLINEIVKLEKPNKYACQALSYAIDILEEQELLSLVIPNWNVMFPLLVINKRFFISGIWLYLPVEQFQTLLLKYSSNDFNEFAHWNTLLNRIIETETLVEDSLSLRIVDNAKKSIDIIFDAANSDRYRLVSPSLLQSGLNKMEELLAWLRAQSNINRRIELFFIHQVKPDSALLKCTSSANWNVLIKMDNNSMDINYYVYLYVLAHNWTDEMSISLLQHSFQHIYKQLSKNLMSDEIWNKLKSYTSSSYKIEKWDKCKILSQGLVDYLKQCNMSVKAIETFTPYKKVNERLLKMWNK